MAKLTAKQQLFIKEYLKDLNATKAAIAAGYPKKTAGAIGTENLQKPMIAAALKLELDKRFTAADVKIDTVLRELYSLATCDVSEAYDENGYLKPIHEIPLQVRRAIAGVETVEEYATIDGKKECIGTTKKLKFWDKNKSLESLGRYLKLFVDRLEKSGPDGGPQVVLMLPDNGRAKPDDK